MKCFNETQQTAIQMVSLLWKTAYKYSSDDVYGDVRELMGNVITAEENVELAEAMGAFSEIRFKVEADARDSLARMEKFWKEKEVSK